MPNLVIASWLLWTLNHAPFCHTIWGSCYSAMWPSLSMVCRTTPAYNNMVLDSQTVVLHRQPVYHQTLSPFLAVRCHVFQLYVQHLARYMHVRVARLQFVDWQLFCRELKSSRLGDVRTVQPSLDDERRFAKMNLMPGGVVSTCWAYLRHGISQQTQHCWYTCLLCVVCVSRLSFWSCWCNLKRAVGAAGCSVPRVRGNPHLLLYGVAAFMWDREKVSNQEVLRWVCNKCVIWVWYVCVFEMWCVCVFEMCQLYVWDVVCVWACVGGWRYDLCVMSAYVWCLFCM